MKNSQKGFVVPLLVGVIVILAIITGVYFYLRPNTNLIVSHSSCNASKEPSSLFLKSYIEQAKWEGNNFVADLKYHGNCSLKDIVGGYKIDGSNINITLNERDGLISANCICGYDTKFEIQKLDKKDYAINLFDQMGNKADSLLLKTDNSVSDACDNNINFGCYGPLLTGKSDNSKSIPSSEIKFIYLNGFEDTASKYPQLEGALKENQRYILADLKQGSMPKISYDSKGQLSLLIPGSTEYDVFTIHLSSGSTFDDAVKNYLEKMATKNRSAGDLGKRLGLEITSLDENGQGFDFLYNGAPSNYNTGRFKFGDKSEFAINFDVHNFDTNLWDVHPIDHDTIQKFLQITSKIYDILKTQKNIVLNSNDLNDGINVYVDAALQNATIDASRTPSQEEIKYFTIHNRSVANEDTIQAKYKIDLTNYALTVLK